MGDRRTAENGTGSVEPEPFPEGPSGLLNAFRRFLREPQNFTLLAGIVLFLALLWVGAEVAEKKEIVRESIRSFLAGGFTEEIPKTNELRLWMAAFCLVVSGMLFLLLLSTVANYLTARAARRVNRSLLNDNARLELQYGSKSAEHERTLGTLQQMESELKLLRETVQKERERIESTFVAQNDRLRRTVNGTILAASRIRGQLFPVVKPGHGKTIREARFTYHISRNFDTQVHRRYVIAAGKGPLHFWESSVFASGDADPAEAFTDIDYRLISRTPGADLVYLPTRDERFSKAASIYFLPFIEPGLTRELEVVYRWPHLFRQLANQGWEKFEFDLNSVEPIQFFELEVFLEGGSGGNLFCSEVGVQLPGRVLETAVNDRGWFGWRYSGRDIPPELLREEIALLLEWKRS